MGHGSSGLQRIYRFNDLVSDPGVSEERAERNRQLGRGIRHPRPPSAGLLGVSPATLKRMIAAGKFPAPIKLTDRLNGWTHEEVAAWRASRQAKGSRK